jgi:thymidine kinase
MFSGKTEELIRRVRRAGFAGRKISVFDHALDEARYRAGYANSHSGWQIQTHSTTHSEEVYRLACEAGAEVVAVDEAQFFDSLLPVCDALAAHGTRVIVAGLNLDFRGEPFETLVEVLARADAITLLSAICTVCGEEATRTQRLIDGEPAPYDSPRIQVGGEESYHACCRHCHRVPGAPARRIG